MSLAPVITVLRLISAVRHTRSSATSTEHRRDGAHQHPSLSPVEKNAPSCASWTSLWSG